MAGFGQWIRYRSSGSEPVEGLPAGPDHRFVVEVLREHLRCEKEILAVVVRDDTPEFCLVHIPLRCVDMGVTGFERDRNRIPNLLAS
jgi:hypothetical protein